jgi:ribosomal protein S18 acetylase RimI-like enzyme
MWVAPGHRHLGIGRQLVRAVMDWAKAKNLETLVLFVTDKNESAIRFYESVGLEMTGRTKP